MKRIFFSLLVLAAIFAGQNVAFAQGQRAESVRIAYITQDLALTATQAEKFWPLFNDYALRRKALQMRMRLAQDKALADASTDADVYAAIEDIVAVRKLETELLVEYMPKLKAQLTAKQLGKLVTIEKRLAKQMLRRSSGLGGPSDNGVD